jgi:hypothetical protein
MPVPNARTPSRRIILKGLLLGPPLASLILAKTSRAESYNPGPEEARVRYRETEDVRAFYRTNGYETLKR